MGELREGEAMLGERCSHGKTWAESCPECDLVSAREFVQRWGPMVDEARAKIAEAGAVETNAEVKG
jgi:hypothetical protein